MSAKTRVEVESGWECDVLSQPKCENRVRHMIIARSAVARLVSRRNAHKSGKTGYSQSTATAYYHPLYFCWLI